MNWKKLQNGSDIRGVAMDGIKGEEINLTTEVAKTLGNSFAHWLGQRKAGKLKVAVGRDSRITGPVLEEAFISGLTEMGVDVFQCGLASTPAMFMATQHKDVQADGGVMLTASHLPFNRNGLKFFTPDGGVNKSDISDILDIAEKSSFKLPEMIGACNRLNFIDLYADFLVDYIRKETREACGNDLPLSGLKIIVDAGNGAGGFFADKVLEKLGADIRDSQFLDPDGSFPNHIPNPENKEAMESVCNSVIARKADLGIIFDTDVDRAAIVTNDGKPVNRNDLIAMISAVILKEHPGSVIVTDSITSEGLTSFIERNLGGEHHRFRRGYKNVINESIRLNREGKESWLAIETSGHAALKENFFLDDGAYLVAKLLVELAKLKAEGKDLKNLLSGLARPAESREYRFSIRNEEFLSYGEKVLTELKASVENMEGWEVVTPNFEGLRVRCTGSEEKGWFLIRMSLHDPVMPVNIESDIGGGVQVIADKFYQLVEIFKDLDYSSLKK